MKYKLLMLIIATVLFVGCNKNLSKKETAQKTVTLTVADFQFSTFLQKPLAY